MKKIKILPYLFSLLLLVGCEQEVIELQPPPEPSGEPGSADFTNFVAIGNSMTAGFQAAALFNEGQQNSFPAIMAEQFAIVSTNNEFNQPDINSVNGYNATYSIPGIGVILGRLILFDPDGTGPAGPGPAPAGLPGMPAPYNTADLPAPYTGDKSELNNFGVPGIILAQALTPFTGGPSTGNPAYNPFYARFASQPGVSTILGDALAVQPTFFSFWLGMNDVLGYAISGGSGAIPLTDPMLFDGLYETALGQILGSNADLKGIVGNIPDITVTPFFTTIGYDAVALDAPTATQLTNGFAGYNAILDALKGPQFNYPAATVDARKISFAAGSGNRIVIIDKTVKDYGDEFDALLGAEVITADQRNDLIPYEQVRQTSAEDLILLTAGAILGTAVEGVENAIYGLTVPLPDEYILLPTEITAINNTRAAFNTTIEGVVSSSNNRLALADMDAAYDALTTGTTSVDGVPVESGFIPPFGLFSEDGLHTNNRGSAYIARAFVEAINQKFGASVPLPNILTYKGTALPVAP